jgi:hypothetical protein
MKMYKIVTVAALNLLAVAAYAEDPAKITDRKSPNYVRCVRLEVTGSLVKKTRVCKTNAEWNQIQDNQSREAADLIERNRTGMNPSS